jgi:hypothetical protein
VIFTPEELSPDGALHGAMRFKEFLPAQQVGPDLARAHVYLGADKGGERAYKLLAEAIEESSASDGPVRRAREQYLIDDSPARRPVGHGAAAIRGRGGIRDIAEFTVPKTAVKRTRSCSSRSK